MTHGIPSDQVPITASGRIKTTNHQRWVKFQREKEDTIQMGLPPFEGVDCPLVTDIPIGNAGHNNSFKNNPGNAIYRDVMEVYFNRYEAATDTQEKTRITWKVLEELKHAGVRILVRDRRGWWTVASTNKSREKIAHDFREYRKRKQRAAGASASSKRRAIHDDTTTSTPTSGLLLLSDQTASAAPSDLKKRCLGRRQLGETETADFSGNSSDINHDSDVPACLRTFR